MAVRIPTSPHAPEDRRRVGMGLAFGGQDIRIRTKSSYAVNFSAPLWQRIRWGVILTVALAPWAGGVQAVAAATGYGQQPVLKASQLVPAMLLKGTRFQVDEMVPTDDFLARFAVRSDFGTFEAHGRDMLQIRVVEVAALEQLEAASKTETFAKALGSAAVRPVKAAGQIITNPVETAKGIPGGVERFFGRVKRGAEHLWEATTESDKASADQAEELARRVGGISRDALGYEQERRQLSKELKVAPSTNPVLAAKLDEVAWVTFSARLGINTLTAVFVPGSMAISGASFANDLVWDTPTAELLRLNEQKLRHMGLSDKVVRAMTRNPWYSLTVLTAFVTGLEQLQGVTGREAVAALAASVASEAQARFIAEGMQMLVRYHATVEPIDTLTARGTVTARTRSGAVVVQAPVDYVAWTRRVAEFARRPDLKASQRSVWLTGQMSSRARREFPTAGWFAHEDVRLTTAQSEGR
jgi:hypothetical protein